MDCRIATCNGGIFTHIAFIVVNFELTASCGKSGDNSSTHARRFASCLVIISAKTKLAFSGTIGVEVVVAHLPGSHAVRGHLKRRSRSAKEKYSGDSHLGKTERKKK
jgi:hypothetical protein